jgi:hypothetical protein
MEVEVETAAGADAVDDDGGRGMGEIVGYGTKPGVGDVEEVMVGVEESVPEDELSEVGLIEDHKGVLELGPVLAPVDSEFVIDDEVLLM